MHRKENSSLLTEETLNSFHHRVSHTILLSIDVWQPYILEANVGIWIDDKARGLGNWPRNAGKGSILRKDLGGKCIGLYFLWWGKEKNSPASP